MSSQYTGTEQTSNHTCSHITSIFVTQFHKKYQEAKLLQLLEKNFGLLMGNQ